MMKKRTLISTMVLTALVGCSGGSSPVNPEEDQTDTRSLQPVVNTQEFADSIRNAVINQFSGSNEVYAVLESTAEFDVAAPTAGDTNAGTTDGGETSSTEVTGTNVQELGVDEADRVKSDGEYLYVLQSSSNGYYPTDTVEPGVVEVDSVSTDEAVPYQPNTNTTKIRMLSLDVESADATLVNELVMDSTNEYPGGLYLYQTDDSDALVLTATSMQSFWGYWGVPYYFGNQQSIIRKVDVSSPADAAVTNTLTIDGHIVSSRRVGDFLYVSSRFYPRIEGVDYSQGVDAIRETVAGTPLDAMMPSAQLAEGNDAVPLVDPSRCFVADKPADAWYSPDIITLFSVDLSDMTVADSVCFLGATETLYASTESIYLATTQHNYFFEGDVVFEGEETVTVAVDPEDGTDDTPSSTTVLPSPEDNLTETNIHQFDFDLGQLSYRGTGTVKGHLGWNESQKSFRLSEKDGYLRVATYSDSRDASISPVFMSVLQPTANNRLEVIARIPNSDKPQHLGKPGERLHASRFLGDKAYLVTFRQTDPLYIVDLAEPTNPYIAADLEIEGYSDYLHPIDDDYLLGIGRGAIPASNGGDDGRGAFATGIKISLFDVSNPAAPAEVQSIEIGKRGTQSEALNDHHGITVQRATADHPTRVTFGIDVADIPQGDTSHPSSWYGWRETGLHAFEVTTDANAGISEHGKMIVETNTPQTPWGPQRYGDRSVIVNDSVFYIHGEQVFGANWNSLGNFAGPR